MGRIHGRSLLATALLCALANTGCASLFAGRSADRNGERPAETAAPDPRDVMIGELRKQVEHLNGTVTNLDDKINALNEKLDRNQALAARSATQEARQMMDSEGNPIPSPANSPVDGHPANHAGSDPDAISAAKDPAAGFVNDRAMAEYREAKILFQSGNYSDAIISFSTFTQKYADHPMAGAAQFYLGECYLRQKEYQLAVREFERVLTTYDRSSHVPITLREIAVAEEALKRNDAAAKHRQLLLSLFPSSPAADGVTLTEVAQTPEPGVGNAVKPVPTGPEPIIGGRTSQRQVEAPGGDGPAEPPTAAPHSETSQSIVTRQAAPGAAAAIDFDHPPGVDPIPDGAPNAKVGAALPTAPLPAEPGSP